MWNASIRALKNVGGDAVVGFASARAVDFWLEVLKWFNAPFTVKAMVAIGEATATHVRDYGFEVQVAKQADALGLADALEQIADPTSTIILPRARNGRTEAIDHLKGRGRTVAPVVLYETVPVTSVEVRDPIPADWVISASPSAVRAYGWHKPTLLRMGLVSSRTLHAALGATTATTARELCIRTRITASSPDIESVLDEISRITG